MPAAAALPAPRRTWHAAGYPLQGGPGASAASAAAIRHEDMTRTASSPRQDQIPLGILYMVGSSLVFAAVNAAVKWEVALYPVGEVAFFRSLFSLVPCYAYRLRGAAHRAPRRSCQARAGAILLDAEHLPGLSAHAAGRRHRHQLLSAAVHDFAGDPHPQGAGRRPPLVGAADGISGRAVCHASRRRHA